MACPVANLVVSKDAEQVEAKSINVVLAHPILERILNHARNHWYVGVNGISRPGKIGLGIVALRNIPKHRFRVSVIVDNINHHAQPGFVKGIDHAFKLKRAILVIVRGLRVALFGYREVSRIVAPVVAGDIL